MNTMTRRFALLLLTSVPTLIYACLSSSNPSIDITTTTVLPCPCMLPSTDTSAECKAPLFGPAAGVPTFTITHTNDPNNPCSADMTGCASYRIVTGGRCNNPVQTFPTTTLLPLICKGGPFFLGPVNPVEKVDCATV